MCKFFKYAVKSKYCLDLCVLFQLVDDLLDYTSSDMLMGKPTTADLRLGLATAPVLFASEQVGNFTGFGSGRSISEFEKFYFLFLKWFLFLCICSWLCNA